MKHCSSGREELCPGTPTPLRLPPAGSIDANGMWELRSETGSTAHDWMWGSAPPPSAASGAGPPTVGAGALPDVFWTLPLMEKHRERSLQTHNVSSKDPIGAADPQPWGRAQPSALYPCD